MSSRGVRKKVTKGRELESFLSMAVRPAIYTVMYCLYMCAVFYCIRCTAMIRDRREIHTLLDPLVRP